MHSTSYGRIRQLPRTALVLVAACFMSTQAAQADTLHAIDDAYIDLVTTSSNFGSNPNLFVQNVKSGDNQTFLRFDLSVLPTGAAIEQATLRLWISKASTPGMIDLHLVTSAWDEDTLTGASAPSTLFLRSFSVGAGDEGDFVTVDVTDEVQDWLDGTETNNGLALIPNAGGVEVKLNSKENSQTSHSVQVEVARSAEGTAGSVPPGAVMAFNLASCPDGWSALTAAQGRYIVGGGTVGSTVGTPLGDTEDRPVGQHNHPNSNSVANHFHSVDPPSTFTFFSGPHSHTVAPRVLGPGGTHGAAAAISIGGSINTGSAGNHRHSVNIGAFNSAGAGSHGHSIPNAGTTAGTNAPYIQLLICEKD